MPQVPRNLDELRQITDRAERIKAANAYISQRDEAIKEARAIRDADIRALADKHGPAETARLSGMSLSTVKAIRR